MKHAEAKKLMRWRINKSADDRMYENSNGGTIGYVYVLRLYPDRNLYKIGHSVQVGKRIKDLQASNPLLQCTIVRRVKDAKKTERALHRKHRARRAQREIFTLEDKHLKSIDIYLTKRRVPDEIPQVGGTAAPRPEWPG